ncbi:unnamed protein product [Camellia sinensis]
MRKLWNLQVGFETLDIGNGFFIVKFQVMEDYSFHWGPWVVMDRYVTIRKWQPDFKSDEAEEDTTAIWVRFPNLPIEYYDEKVLYHIAKVLGKPLKVNINIAMAARGKYARVDQDQGETSATLEIKAAQRKYVDLDMGPQSFQGEISYVQKQSPIGPTNHMKDGGPELGLDVVSGDALMEETAENIPMSEHRVDQFKTLMFLELEKEMYHHVGIDWWLEEVKLLIQSWWERDSHNVRHMVLVKPAKPLEEDQKTVRNILGLSEAEDWPTHKLSSMDMLIWNCRGAGNARFRRNLWELVRLHKPDMIILMKTKVELNTMGMFFNNLGFTASTHVDPTGRSGGIWLLWNPSQTNVRVHDASSQMITTTISRQDYLDWVLSAVYASSNIRMRDELWNDLTTLAQHTQKPWLVAGDFNDYSSFEDKRSFSTSPSQNLSQSQRRSQKFSDRISSCNLMDLGCVGPRLTWTNNRKGWANTMVRLDRALCNTEWQTLFPEGYVHNLPRTYSDHSPILLHTQE